jgi:Tol biopolymer transport system component
MLRRLLVLAAMAPALGCSATLRHGVRTTEAAADLGQVTRSQANEFDPAVSPDASAIAYEAADTPDATPHVEIIPLGGVGSRAIPKIEYTSHDAMGLEPTWTPDGSSIVYVSNPNGARRLVQTFGDGPAHVRFVATAGDPNLYAHWPRVSPDGRSLAVTLDQIELFRTGWRSALSMNEAVGLSDLSGADVTILGAGGELAWSPDGRRIAFARVVGGHAHLFVAKADGADATQITEGPEDDESPSWSPDGRYIVFSSSRSNEGLWTQANLFVVRPDGSGLVQLTEGDRMACRPDWAADGFVYFHANATDRFHIWRIRPISLDGERISGGDESSG